MIKTLTGHDVPEDSSAEIKTLAPGVYLSLFHGRRAPDEQLSDWGTSGPVIGPLRYCHTTYMSSVRFEFMTAEDHDRYFPCARASWNAHTGAVLSWQTENWFEPKGDLLEYNGIFYGDWTVFAVEGKRPEDGARKLLRSIVADVRGMQNERPVYELGHSNDDETLQPHDFFGPFPDYCDENDVDGPCMVEASPGVSVAWPNLRILIEEAEQLLSEVA